MRDANGFRKIALCLTAGGKLLALHNGDGRTLWSRSYAAAAGEAGAGGAGAGAPQHLLPWRTFHDTTHAPQVRAGTGA